MTFAEWRWSEHRGTKSAHQSFRELSNRPEAPFEWLWNPPPGDLGEPANLFASGIYLRAAMTLQALREDVGDPTFFRILSKWAQDNRYGNVYTVGFISLCEEESGRDLNAFFQGCFTSRANPRAGEFSVPSWVAPLDLRASAASSVPARRRRSPSSPVANWRSGRPAGREPELSDRFASLAWVEQQPEEEAWVATEIDGDRGP